VTSIASGQDRYWFLDSVAGWREASREHLTADPPDGNLKLDMLPGSASLLIDASHQSTEFRCPCGICSDGKGNLFVVDASLNAIKRINLARGSIETLPGIGGKGTGAREMSEPRGVGVLANGAVVVADTRNHHVKIFSPPTYALLQDWGANGMLGNPEPGSDRKQFHFPWGVTVGPGNTIYVVDRGNRRIQIIRADGAWLGEVVAETIISPTRLAIGPGGLIAIVDLGANVVVVLRSGFPQLLSGINKPRCVAIDSEAQIYVGDEEGLIHVFVPDPAGTGEYELSGSGLTGFQGSIVDLIWDSVYGLLAIVAETYNGRQQRLWKINPSGAPVRTGTFITQALDSNTPNCQWHRVLVNADVPAGTSLQIDSFSAEALADGANQTTDPSFDQWKLCVKAGTNNPDCLVQSGPGRYLWLRLTFNSNGLQSPEVRWLKAFYPRKSYLRYLPAVYQEDESSRQFLERFLSIFQTEFDHIDRRIDRIWQLFNPGSIPARDLQWLAGWLAAVVDPAWSTDKLRSILQDAFAAQCKRGTHDGLIQAIADYVGVQAAIVEHFKLRQLSVLEGGTSAVGGFTLWSSTYYKRLQLSANSRIGEFQLISDPPPDVEPFAFDAHQFTVLFQTSPYGAEDIEAKLQQVVDREKPAHTQANLSSFLPRFRIGVQSTIGMDSAVGAVSYLVLNRFARLGYDSILAPSQLEYELRRSGLLPRPRVGLSAKLS
jgi:phage tail-like protein